MCHFFFFCTSFRLTASSCSAPMGRPSRAHPVQRDIFLPQNASSRGSLHTYHSKWYICLRRLYLALAGTGAGGRRGRSGRRRVGRLGGRKVGLHRASRCRSYSQALVLMVLWPWISIHAQLILMTRTMMKGCIFLTAIHSTRALLRRILTLCQQHIVLKDLQYL